MKRVERRNWSLLPSRNRIAETASVAKVKRSKMKMESRRKVPYFLSILSPSSYRTTKNLEDMVTNGFDQIVSKLSGCDLRLLDENYKELFKKPIRYELCEVPIHCAYQLIKHITGIFHNWKIHLSGTGVSAASVEYWIERINEIHPNPNRSIKCSNTAELFMYSLDLHLLFCTNPDHHKVKDVEEKLTMLSSQWNQLNINMKKEVKKGIIHP
ncbi:hypothetical protein PFISCL1PPCAC_3895, partial [Pristionchus fissidentatus]